MTKDEIEEIEAMARRYRFSAVEMDPGAGEWCRPFDAILALIVYVRELETVVATAAEVYADASSRVTELESILENHKILTVEQQKTIDLDIKRIEKKRGIIR